MAVIAGKKYKHYKGGSYLVHYLAKHTETGEDLVVYESLDKGGIWVRPLKMFEEFVLFDNQKVPRFQQIDI